MDKKCKICGTTILQKRIYCSNKCKFSDNDYNKKRSVKKISNKETEKLKCNLCNFETKDVNNLSGTVTVHLRDNHNITDGEYHNYFSVVKVEEKEKWNCPICDWNTTDIQNKSGCITVHLQKNHNLSLTLFNEQYPDNEVIPMNLVKAKRFLGNNKKNYVTCKICNEKMGVISNTHCMNKHGITQKEYKERYDDKITSELTSELLKPCGGSKTFVSKGETEVYEYLKSLGVDDVRQTKYMGGYELDVYSDKHKIGIEYNGLYWHSELNGRSKSYHIDKTNYFEGKGIRVVHIFEDEWNNKKEIVKSKLKHLFGKFDGTRIYARNCQIKEIQPKLAAEFLNRYHIQGNDKSKYKFGAYYGDELVSVVTFSSKRISLGSSHKDGEFELGRFCVSDNYLIVGILPKFISHFSKNLSVSKILTYADRRYSIKENIYEKIGFEYKGKTKPNYFYMNDYSVRKHRYNFTKHKFVQMGGDKELTEWENAVKLGFDRIWDCGSFRYEMDIG